ncbi:MAG: hypothetical protein AB7N53_19490 [Candidatus Binatia bacterium]
MAEPRARDVPLYVEIAQLEAELSYLLELATIPTDVRQRLLKRMAELKQRAGMQLSPELKAILAAEPQGEP